MTDSSSPSVQDSAKTAEDLGINREGSTARTGTRASNLLAEALESFDAKVQDRDAGGGPVDTIEVEYLRVVRDEARRFAWIATHEWRGRAIGIERLREVIDRQMAERT